MNTKNIAFSQQLKIAGILTFAVALFQAIITISPEWSRYFGAGESLVSKIWLLYISGFIVTLIFILFGFYALSGAGIIKRLPFLRTGLVIICALFTLRGLEIVMDVLIATGKIHARGNVPIQFFAESIVSLVIGLLYLFGIIGAWARMQNKKTIYRKSKELMKGYRQYKYYGCN